MSHSAMRLLAPAVIFAAVLAGFALDDDERAWSAAALDAVGRARAGPRARLGAGQ